MREIKFRVWDIKGMKMHYPSLIAISRIGACRIDFDTHFYPDECVIQQYTGLKDGKGRYIYEGDILKHQHFYSENESTSIVRWSEEHEDNHPGFRITNLMTQGGEMTVIGNIYDNPELLK